MTARKHRLHTAAKAKADAALTRHLKALAIEFAGSKIKGAKLFASLEAGRLSKPVSAFAAIAFPLLEARQCLRD